MKEKSTERKNAKAINYDELMKYLPTSIDGYTLNGEPKGASMDMSEMSYSSAEVSFNNDKGDRIHITLLDYNAAASLYGMTTAMWASGFKIDSSEEFGQSISISDDISGWETIKKKTKKANIVLGIADRFLLTVEGDNQEDCEFLKEVAKSMDLDKLVALD